ncbi:MAG: CDP-diacylglycerol--glycerol-3-phosphate 3-phosphatidyltransferase [Rickettsiales bacterium]|nr:CDP-diacylglycerol--glycerol-3-phosphate 3-phosphatidyltransferase [Rickettsiales bacterium]
MKNIPNILTFIRIIVIPILISSFFLEGVISNWLAATLFIFASITDFFDGYIARAYKVQSNLGKVFDPIADKILVATAIVMLVHFGSEDILITIPGIIILFREIFVSGLREFLAELNISMPVSRLAKWKTGVQMTALSLMILGDKGTGIEFTNELGRFGLIIAAILTIITGFAYLKASLKHLRK